MRLIITSAVLSLALALTVWLPAPRGGAEALRLAQADVDTRMGPSRSPKVVIEEPRPPAAAIETEGRGPVESCRPVTVTERQDGVLITRTERRCDR
jgi:hypothetical protein